MWHFSILASIKAWFFFNKKRGANAQLTNRKTDKMNTARINQRRYRGGTRKEREIEGYSNE